MLERLNACFMTVGLNPAGRQGVAPWGELAHIRLLNAIAEEFGVAFSPDEFLSLLTYPLIVSRLKRHG